MQSPLTLTKAERVCSKSLLEKLFGKGGKRTIVAYPLRAVYLIWEGEGVPVQMMVSVPKRNLKHAVDRNRVKRQVREAFRKHKMPLADAVKAQTGRRVAVAFVWMSQEVTDSTLVETSVCRLLQKVQARVGGNTKSET